MTWRALVALTVAAVAVVPVAGQQPVFSSRVDVVRIDALVTRGARVVSGLGPSDFEIRDNGVLQEVGFVSFDEIPLNVVLAFDMSGSVSGARLENLRTASRAVLTELKPKDRAGLVTFGSAVVVSAALTSDVTEMQAALDTGERARQTSLVDAAFAGLMLGVSDAGRSLLLIFSDGVDTASWLSPRAVIDAAKRGDVVANGVVVGAAPKASFLRDLTSATGGDLVEVKTTTNLNDVFLRLLNEYRQRYVLGYTPRGVAKGGWHQVDVRVKTSGATVKARPGYLSGAVN